MKCKKHPWRQMKRRSKGKWCLKCWFMRRFRRWIRIEATSKRKKKQPVQPKTA